MKVVKIKNYIHLQFELNLFAPFNFFRYHPNKTF